MCHFRAAVRLLLTGAILASAGCREPNVMPAALAGQDASVGAPAPVAGAGLAGDDAVGDPPDLSSGVEAASLCNIESINGAALDATPHPIAGSEQVRGWLGSEGGAALERPLLVLADARGAIVRHIPLSPTIERPDVGAAFPDRRGLVGKGFAQDIDGAGLAGGDYHLFLVYESNGRRFVCDNGRLISIR